MVSAPEVVSSQVEERPGVVANAADMDPLVISAFNDAVGRVSIITTTDGKRFNGYVGSIGFDDNIMSLATYWTTEITDRNRANLMRCESETTEKVTFKFDDIVDIQVLSHDGRGQKLASKFVTDRVYHGESLKDDEDLQEWCGGEEEEGIGGSIEDQEPTNNQHNRRSNQNNGPGWSAADMFAANEKHVFSTFKEDLTQYTTVEVTGTDEDRARAERLAREIESNQNSKFYANLENDDVERDLDKTTREDDFEYNGRRRGNNSYSQQPQQRRNQNPNITPNGQPVNRRAEGLRSDRRNSGSNSANNSRYGSGQSQGYVPQGAKGGYGNNSRRQNEEYRDNEWQNMAKGKGQSQSNEQSFRHQPKQMLDPRPTSKQAGAEGDKTGNSRVAGLKSWGTDFAIATSPKEQSPAPAQGNSGSAWNRGPPSSLVGKGSSSTESTPPPEDLEAPANEHSHTTSSKSGTEKREDLPSTSSEVQEDVDGKQNEGDDLSTTGASETSSVSKSFKFNINAPEFKPRVAPTTPTPTTPTGPTPQNEQIQQQQFAPHDYQQQQPQQHPGMAMQGAPMGMPGPMVHMVPGGVPTSQNQHVMMWQHAGHQSYQPNQQYPMQQVAMPGVPGQMYGPAATAPATVQNTGNQQIVNAAAGGAPVDGRQQNAPARRDGENQPCFYQYTQNGPVIQNIPPGTFYPQQYQQMPQGQYPMKMVPQPGPQGYQRQYQQPMFVPRFQPHQQQQHFVNEQTGAPQSHPNSQPTTPGPRGDQNAPKQGQQQPQNGNNVTEGRSSASLSGSASSQSGQRCGSPQNGAPQQPQQQLPQQQQQQPMPQPHGVHPQGQMVGMPGYVMIPGAPPPMHQHAAPYYHQQQQGMYYNVMMPQQMPMQPNQHISDQQSVMGERADQGFPQSNIFDFRMYQQQHQHAQHQHGGHMSRQNSLPQPFNGGQVLKV